MIVLLIYIVGCVLGYFVFKYKSKKESGEWLRGDRKIGLFFSIFSWFTVAASLIELAIRQSENDDKPAKW